jgi:hypothetical protein
MIPGLAGSGWEVGVELDVESAACMRRCPEQTLHGGPHRRRSTERAEAYVDDVGLAAGDDALDDSLRGDSA